VFSYLYVINESCGTFLLFEINWANQFPNQEVKDYCLKLDWFSSGTDKPENLRSHLYPTQ